jgi:hypothetical protein
MERFEALPQETQGLAYVFRALNRPRTRHSLLAGLVSCMLLQLLVGAPYAANELAADASPALRTALRGLIIGITMCFIFGPIALILAPTMVRGGFHPWSFLSLPITLGIAVGLACIPVNGSTLGFGSIGLLTYGLTFVVFNLVLNAPFYATDEHKALQRSSGPPQMLIGGLFFGLVAAYVTLAQLYSSTLVGLLLPIGSSLTSRLAIYFLVRSFHTFYYKPKQAFLAQLPQNQGVVPPLLGDIEMNYGHCASFFALIIGNVGSVATIVGAMLAPDSSAWVLSLSSSALLEVLARNGILQRVEVSIAARLAAKFGLLWPMRLAQTSAVKLVYLHSLGGTGYVAPMMALCIGCLRAATIGDPRAIIWLDESSTVWRVLLAQLVLQMLSDAATWALKKKGLQHFELSARFAPGHPLRNTELRDFALQGYVLTFFVGGTFIYAVFVAFLGPAFVMGMCRNFDPNSTHIWVVHGLECAKTTAAAGLGNVSVVLPPASASE